MQWKNLKINRLRIKSANKKGEKELSLTVNKKIEV